jgi:hypothetical protein
MVVPAGRGYQHARLRAIFAILLPVGQGVVIKRQCPPLILRILRFLFANMGRFMP